MQLRLNNHMQLALKMDCDDANSIPNQVQMMLNFHCDCFPMHVQDISSTRSHNLNYFPKLAKKDLCFPCSFPLKSTSRHNPPLCGKRPPTREQEPIGSAPFSHKRMRSPRKNLPPRCATCLDRSPDEQRRIQGIIRSTRPGFQFGGSFPLCLGRWRGYPRTTTADAEAVS